MWSDVGEECVADEDIGAMRALRPVVAPELFEEHVKPSLVVQKSRGSPYVASPAYQQGQQAHQLNKHRV